MYEFNEIAARAPEQYFYLMIQGRGKEAKELLEVARKKTGFTFVDCSSSRGIPDCICIGNIDAHAYQMLNSSDGIRQCHREIEIGAIKDGVFEDMWEPSPFSNVAEIDIPVRQSLTGSCNEREENKVLYASKLTKLSFSAFVTKATLYMARFINRHRRNEQGHPYHPGEAYLFMEHGERMQDAFTPEEVQQAMEKVGISGSRIANDLKAELERLRDARMNPEAGSMYVPE